jgi:putative DNA primase/helicase
MTWTEDLENRFNKHPETSINGGVSLDEEFISLLQNNQELYGLIEKDADKSRDDCIKIISKLCILEFSEITSIITDYGNSKFWDSLGSEKQLEFIETIFAIQEEKEQDVIESTGPDKNLSGSEKVAQGKPKKIDVPFDVVADKIRQHFPIFTMRDNKQIYLYKDGVYKSDGSEAILDTAIRNKHNEIYTEFWNNKNLGFPIDHVPKATVKFVSEVLAHIRAYTHISRDSIEQVQSKYINCKNGIFNLETWELENHCPEIKSICQIPVIHDKEAKCPKTTNFLKSIVAESDINLLNEIAGYCLTTDCSQQKAFMLHGVGSNGKSVFLAVLESLVGRENTSAESLQKLEFDKYRPAKLYGKLVNICGDIPDVKMQKSENFKKLTSGFDLIDGENKYQDPFTFKNTAKLIFSANAIPEGKRDKAYYRRWILIRFPNNFEGENADKALITKLQTPEELSGHLNLALDGLKKLRENGKFSNEKSIEATQKEYEFNSNPISAFMEERTQTSDEDCEAIILYLEYVDWCKSCGKEPWSNIGLSRKLVSMGYTSHRENIVRDKVQKKVVMFDNLKIRSDRIEQDKTGYENANNLSCPSLLDIGKTEIGQDVNPFVTNNDSFPIYVCKDIMNVSECINNEKCVNAEISLTRKDSSCLNMRFLDISSLRVGYNDNIENHPVQEQKMINYEQSNEANYIKKLENIMAFKTDLKNLVTSKYKGTVESVPDLLDDFTKLYPGYKQILEHQDLLKEAEKLNSWGWT